MSAPFFVDRFSTGGRHELRLDGAPTFRWALRRLYRAARRGGLDVSAARTAVIVCMTGNVSTKVTVVERERAS